VHPPFVVADRAADLFEFDFAHHGARRRWERTPIGWLTSLPRRAARAGFRWLTANKV
jgi:hypothetical protein